jgi:hypothetical protein
MIVSREYGLVPPFYGVSGFTECMVYRVLVAAWRNTSHHMCWSWQPRARSVAHSFSMQCGMCACVQHCASLGVLMLLLRIC